MRVFKTKWFARYAKREGINDSSLFESVERVERGLVDVDLGFGLIKQRVARQGQGRSGGHRLLLAYRVGDLAIFLYGFAKNEKDNIAEDELKSFREIAASWLKADAKQLESEIVEGRLQEVYR